MSGGPYRAGKMRRKHIPDSLALIVGLAILVPARQGPAGGVTFITHGLNGNVTGWVTGMANQIPSYYLFPDTNFTCYEAYFYSSGSSYILTAARVAGDPPQSPGSGEIIVKFDWSQLAGGNSYNTYQVAAVAVPALLSTNFIPELGGHALAEFSLHLAGHSRGGSLVCEISRLLGTNGIWVDHLTTLDPHPLNNDGFSDWLYSAVDAPARTYVNVLFHDNYWQDLDFFVYGEPVSGAYVRKLTSLSGGYSGIGGAHSDVHLWYHGTIDFRNPASDTEASITSSERTSWWDSAELQGTNAGFKYSLIGRGNRLSAEQPLGQGQPAIRDGFNQYWDLGAGVSANRINLAANAGYWPDLIRINRTETNSVVQGQSIPIQIYYQWAHPATDSAVVRIYLDDDLNPLNLNQRILKQYTVPGTGGSSVALGITSVPMYATNASPGWHTIFASITAGTQTRYLYAPEPILVVAPPPPPTLDITCLSASQVCIGVNGSAGQTVVIQTSSDLITWYSQATNTLVSARWVLTNSPPAGVPMFYRALLSGQ